MLNRATSDIQIAQRAMLMAGMQALDTFEDPNPQANVVKQLYEDLVTAELASHDWKFCTGDEVMQRLATKPLYGFSAAYKLPDNTLSLKAVTIGGIPQVWRRSGEAAFVNANETDEVVFTGQLRAPTDTWPPYFTLYFEARLAAWISASITRNGGLADNWNETANSLLLKARSRDAMQQTVSRFPIGRYTSVRRGAHV
jgi:hypothetical protein